MFRITVHDKPGTVSLQLEGRLVGDAVQVLEECWQSAVPRQQKAALRVDLTGVTSIDDLGYACLELLHRQGARFIAADCFTKAVVAEITGAPSQAARNDGSPPPTLTK